jgi:hypothetical protein
MPCTVIQEGDVSDTFLDRQLKPRWKGERCAMVIKWPAGITDTEITEDTEAGQLWNEYARLRLTGLQQDGDHAEATKFYQQHRARWMTVSSVPGRSGTTRTRLWAQRRDLRPAACHEPAAG